MKKILISLIIFNQILLFVYFVYHLNDRDLDISQMRQSLFQINHQELYKDEQEYSEEQEFSEEDEQIIQGQQNLDILYKDVDETLDFIGDDNMDQKQSFINEALNSIDIIPNVKINQQSVRSQNQLKLLKDPHYCHLNNMYYYTHNPIPLTIITDFDVKHPASKAIDEIGQDVLPAIPLYSSKLYNIPLNTSMYFIENLNFYKYFNIGTEAICYFQSINIIPGSEILFLDYHKLQLNIPTIQNYAMKDEQQCKQVMQMNETEVDNYLMKFKKTKALHLEKLKKKYHNGVMCGKIMDNIIIQKKTIVEQQYYNIVLLSQPNKYKYFNNHTYDSSINDQLNNISFTILNEAQKYMEQDYRFFQLFYFTFIQNAGQIYFNSISIINSQYFNSFQSKQNGQQ